MTKRRSTKRALLLSALSLLMCVSMLIGSTFAWFTDSVTSKNNIIKSGNLDVELDYIKVVDGVATDWATVKDQDNIFNKDALWEPGHVEVVYLRVSNKGSLQLKYQLGVNVYKEIIGKNEKGEDIKLSDYLVFKTIEIDEQDVATFTRESAKAEAGTVTGLKDYNGTTTALEVGGVDYLALIVYMPEIVGNEANYRGTDVPTIELGINLYATQYTAEEDSFDEFYDKDAWNNAMKVYNEADLATAIKNVEDGGLIVIADDLTLEKGINSGSTWYEGYYYNGDKSFTIDLNGKTLTNAGTKINDYLLLFKNDGEKANTITLKNGTLEATSSAYCAICTSTTSTQKITINLEDVNLIGNNSNGAVAKIRGGAELNVKAGTVITGKNSFAGIEAAGNNTVVNIFDGAEIYQNGTSSYVGSLVGASGGATVNVYGGSGVSAKGGFIAMTSGGTINVSGGEWIANTDGTYANSNQSVLIAQSDNRAKSVVNVYGGTFKGGYNCYGNVAGDAQINISGGNFNANPATYVENSYKAIENNGKYYVVANDVDNLIGSADELYALRGTGWSGPALSGTYALVTDIDMSGYNMTPIVIQDKANFTFLGNGHTISNLNLVEAEVNVKVSGLFTARLGVDEVNISNLTLKNVTSTSSKYSSAVLAYIGDKANAINITNVDVKNATITGESVAALVTYSTQPIKLTDCDVSGLKLEGAFAENKVGALVGTANTASCVVTVNNCTNETTYNDAGRVINGATWKGAIGVSSIEDLQKLVNEAKEGTTEIVLRADLTGNVTLPKKTGTDITIDGNGKTFTGIVTVNGGADSGDVTIKNIKFVAAAGAGSAIVAPGSYVDSSNGVTYNNYVYNLTVENCTFTDPDGVQDCAAVRATNGGHHNWTLKNLTVDSTMHSLFQGGNVETDFVIDGCNVSSKNGANLQYSTSLKMTDCTFDVTGYAVRIGVNNATVNGTYSIDGCELKSANNDGDAVIVFRGDMTGSTMTITDTTLIGTPEINGNANVVR